MVGGACGAGGDLVWEDHVDTAGGADGINALAVRSGLVFAAGFDTNTAGNRDFLVRAYDAESGTLLWKDQVDKAGAADRAFALAAGAGQVFAGGFSTNAEGNQDFLVRAYNAKTGALLWEDQVDPVGGFDGVNALAVEGGRLFAAGFITNAAGNFDALLRAYEAKSGALLWEDQIDRAGFDDAALALTVERGQVFIAGFGTNAAGNFDVLVRAYQAKTGTLVWEDQVDKAGFDDAALALAAGGGHVVAAGAGTTATGDMDVLIRAYDRH